MQPANSNRVRGNSVDERAFLEALCEHYLDLDPAWVQWYPSGLSYWPAQLEQRFTAVSDGELFELRFLIPVVRRIGDRDRAMAVASTLTGLATGWSLIVDSEPEGVGIWAVSSTRTSMDYPLDLVRFTHAARLASWFCSCIAQTLSLIHI